MSFVNSFLADRQDLVIHEMLMQQIQPVRVDKTANVMKSTVMTYENWWCVCLVATPL